MSSSLQELPPELIHVIARFYCRSVPSAYLFSSISRKFSEVLASGLVFLDLILLRWPSLAPHLLEPSILSYREQLAIIYRAELSGEFSASGWKSAEPDEEKAELTGTTDTGLTSEEARRIRQSLYIPTPSPVPTTTTSPSSSSPDDDTPALLLLSSIQKHVSSHTSHLLTKFIHPLLTEPHLDPRDLAGRLARRGPRGRARARTRYTHASPPPATLFSFGSKNNCCLWFVGRFFLLRKTIGLLQYGEWHGLVLVRWGVEEAEGEEEEEKKMKSIWIVPRRGFLSSLVPAAAPAADAAVVPIVGGGAGARAGRRRFLPAGKGLGRRKSNEKRTRRQFDGPVVPRRDAAAGDDDSSSSGGAHDVRSDFSRSPSGAEGSAVFDKLAAVRMDKYVAAVAKRRVPQLPLLASKKDFSHLVHEKLLLWAADGVLDLPRGLHFRRVVRFLARFEKTLGVATFNAFVRDRSLDLDGTKWYQNFDKSLERTSRRRVMHFAPRPFQRIRSDAENEEATVVFRRKFFFAVKHRELGVTRSHRNLLYGEGVLSIGTRSFLLEMHVRKRLFVPGRRLS